jgi:hypothetical protein
VCGVARPGLGFRQVGGHRMEGQGRGCPVLDVWVFSEGKGTGYLFEMVTRLARGADGGREHVGCCDWLTRSLIKCNVDRWLQLE